MGQIETKKLVKIQFKKKEINELELNPNSPLNITRKKIKKTIDFPFTFLDENFNEISEADELSTTLNDILEGKKLYIKKKKKERNILGEKIYSKNGLNFFLYPKIYLTDIQEKNSSNIMIIGETGVGKSTWIHSLLNYLENIEIDEEIRYLLFDEKKKQKEYEIKYGKKQDGSSITDEPEIYEIAPTVLYNNSLKLIDTSGFGDTRGIEYDNKIVKEIYNFLNNSNINNLKSICLVFKASETRAHERLNYLLKRLFSLFADDVKKNFIIIFNFVDSLTDISVLDVLKNKKLPFYEIFGDIENLPRFCFNNKAYFDSDTYYYNAAFENNNKNFEEFFKYLSKLKPVSLERTKNLLYERIQIREKIDEIYVNISHIKNEISLMINRNKTLSNKKIQILNYYNSPYILYCKNHDKICHKNCNGPKICSHFEQSNNCDECHCSNSNHRYIMNYDDKKEKEYNKKLFDDINFSNEESNKSNNIIYHFFMTCIETLQDLIKKNKELNSISLNKEDENNKNEYILNILNEIIKEKDKIKDFFQYIIQNIENLDDDMKSEMIKNFINDIRNNNQI